MNAPLRIGTRDSRLALWQANHIADLLRPLAVPRLVDELVEISTLGDQVRDRALSQIGGEGVFTKEIQNSLLADKVDVAVHSLKDLPTTPVAGLVLAAVPPRGPTGDVLVSKRHASFDTLPQGAVIATGSLRRRSQALYRRPDLRLVDIRGNVETRLQKLTQQNLDAVILAQAGLERLGLDSAITEILDAEWMLPAVGQGALGLECRADDSTTFALLERLNDQPTRQAVLAERAMLRGLGGGCQMPIAAAGIVSDKELVLRGAVLSQDGRQRIADETRGPASEAEELGNRLAVLLSEQGAKRILMELADNCKL